MAWFRRDALRDVPKTTVGNGQVANRLEEVTERLEKLVQQLYERLDEIEREDING